MPAETSAATSADPPAGDEALDPGALTTARLEADICTLAGHLAAATCRWLVLVGEFDRRGAWAAAGTRSGAQWLSWRCGMGGGTAREHIRVGRALLELPLMRAAFAAGRLSFSKVRALTRIATPALEAELVHLGLGTTAAQVDRLVREYRRAVAREEPPLPSPATVTRRWDDDGHLVVTARLGPDEGAMFIAAIEAYVDILHNDIAQGVPPSPALDEGRAPEATPRDTDPAEAADAAASAGACPELDQVRRSASPVEEAEALLAMAHAALTHGPCDASGADRYLVVVHADIDQLRSASAESDASSHHDQAGSNVDARDGNTTQCGPAEGGTNTARPSTTTATRSPAPCVSSTTAPSSAAASTAEARSAEAPTAEARSAEASTAEAPTAQPSRLTRGRCHLRGGPAVFAETLRRIACDARVRLMTHDAAGSPKDVGRRQRLVTPALRSLLEERDEGYCRFPACRRRRRLHAHHVVHWADGGPTNLSNLLLLCHFHHQLVHEHGFSVASEHDGSTRFRRPDGTLIEAVPATRGDGRLEALDQALYPGAAISDETTTPEWWGDPLHVADVVDGLFRLRAAGDPTAFSAATAAAARGVPAAMAFPVGDPWSRSGPAAGKGR